MSFISGDAGAVWDIGKSIFGGGSPKATVEQNAAFDTLYSALNNLGGSPTDFTAKWAQGAADYEGFLTDMWFEIQGQCRKKQIPPFDYPPPSKTIEHLAKGGTRPANYQYYTDNLSKASKTPWVYIQQPAIPGTGGLAPQTSSGMFLTIIIAVIGGVLVFLLVRR